MAGVNPGASFVDLGGCLSDQDDLERAPPLVGAPTLASEVLDQDEVSRSEVVE